MGSRAAGLCKAGMKDDPRSRSAMAVPDLKKNKCSILVRPKWPSRMGVPGLCPNLDYGHVTDWEFFTPRVVLSK